MAISDRIAERIDKRKRKVELLRVECLRLEQELSKRRPASVRDIIAAAAQSLHPDGLFKTCTRCHARKREVFFYRRSSWCKDCCSAHEKAKRSLRCCRICGEVCGQGKSYCLSCYIRHRTETERQRKQQKIPCSKCGQPCSRLGNRTKQCVRCVRTSRRLIPCPRCSKPFWPWASGKHPRKFCGCPTIPAAQKKHEPRVYTKACAWCGQQFSTRFQRQRFCCDSHNNIAKSQQRKARLRKLGGEAPPLGFIYERDKGICWICRKRVSRALRWPHPLSPSRDHVIPTAKLGRDEATNIRLAHLKCNLRKRDRIQTLF